MHREIGKEREVGKRERKGLVEGGRETEHKIGSSNVASPSVIYDTYANPV